MSADEFADGGLEAWVEARLAGDRAATITPGDEDSAHAQRALDALELALTETVFEATGGAGDRPPPVLPADYELGPEIGRGGMGIVYSARQKSLDREVAVKVLRAGEAQLGSVIRRFLDEAKHLARLRHPAIVAIHEIGEAEGEPYFTMDLVRGESLAALLRRGPLPPTRAIAILEQCADAVRYAHEHGIIHRDLKPANILLEDSGRAYVTDFGLARDLARRADLTRSGEMLGTPAYMAREQALGQSDLVGEATDVYALGAVLYEMLTGRPPHGNDAPAEVLSRVLHGQVVAPRRLDRRIPKSLETVVLKALQPHPHHRYETVLALLEDLRRARDGRPVLARRPGVAARLAGLLRRHGRPAAAVVGATALLTLVLQIAGGPDEPTLLERAAAHEQAGDLALAVRVYRSAYDEAPDEQKPAIVASMVRSCAAIRDTKTAVNSALLVLECDPDVSFGELDFLLAEALVGMVQARDRAGTPWTDRDARLFELADRRLRSFLERRDAPVKQRESAALSARYVRRLLEKHRPPGDGTEPPEPRPDEIPGDLRVRWQPAGVGDPESLLRVTERASRWYGARAAYQAGHELEGRGESARARVAYELAFDLVRARWPIYEYARGAMMHTRFTRYHGDDDDRARSVLPTECRLLRLAHDGVRRTDPDAPHRMRGGLRLVTTGASIPDSLEVSLLVELRDPEVEASLLSLLSGTFSIALADGAAEIGVADGRYLFRVTGYNTSNFDLDVSGHELDAGIDEAADRFTHFAELDLGSLPAEVEVRGETVELPPIRIWLKHEVVLEAPAAAASVTPESAVFRWSPVEGAAAYALKIGSETLTIRGTSVDAGREPRLAELLAHVGSGTWSVEALSEDDRVIGITNRDDTKRALRVIH